MRPVVVEEVGEGVDERLEAIVVGPERMSFQLDC